MNRIDVNFYIEFIVLNWNIRHTCGAGSLALLISVLFSKTSRDG